MTYEVRMSGSRINGRPDSGLPLFAEARWKLDGSCATSDPDAWFPDQDGDQPVREQFTKSNEKGRPVTAKSVCRACPVRTECLTWALENREPHGIWGGLTTKERRRLLREGVG